MGYMRHHSIAVSGFKNELKLCHKYAKRLFGEMVTPIKDTLINGELSFFIGPDGSKEGWPESNEYDQKRETFITFIKSLKYEDESSPVSFCHFYWKDEDHKCEILDHN